MKISKYEHFFDLYKYLDDAVFSIWTETTESDSDYTIELKNRIGKILMETDHFTAISFDSIMDEIQQNLTNLKKKEKENFIKNILRKWAKFIPFFDIHNKRKTYWFDGRMLNPDSEVVDAARNSIIKNELPIKRLKASVFEQYLSYCYMYYQEFFRLLNYNLSILNIDFDALQDKVFTPPQKTILKNPGKTDDIKNNKQTRINELQTCFSDEKLGNLFDNLNKRKKRIPDNLKKEFINLFSTKSQPNESRINWLTSNSELATLIFKLTDKVPVPNIVNKYFITSKTYDSNSHSGKRRENLTIIKIVKSIK